MTTGQSDVLVVPRDQSIGNDSALATNTEGDDHTRATDASTRSRKRVTFDLDLQVRTIPNRIPMYERRPAYNNSGHLIRGRSPQSNAVVPRPLDIRGRDRYLIGAANLSAKRIIDLFSVPNGYPNYPAPPRGQTRSGGQQPWRRQTYGNAATTGSAAVRHPAYALDGTKSAKMSRAAANLKQITAALGEHFDSSVYQEWDTSSTSNANQKKGFATISQHGSQSPDPSASSASCSTINLTPSRTFTPTRPKTYFPYRHQLTPKSMSPTESNLESSSSESATRTSLMERSRSTSHSATCASSSRKLPVVAADQPGTTMRDSQLIISKAPANQRPDVRRRNDGGVNIGIDRFRRVPSAPDRSERASSRCSTIDTYVIPEPFESDNATAPVSNVGLGSRIGTERRTNPGPGKSRSTAWEGADISVTEPALAANALRTSKPGQSSVYGSGSGGGTNWYVPGKPPNR